MATIEPRFFFVLLAVTVTFQRISAFGDGRNYSWPCMCLQKVTDNMYNPVEYISFRRPDNSVLTLIAEQKGTVRAWKVEGEIGTELPLFMNITDRVHTSEELGEERGLLSVTLHPLYNETGRVFAFYVATETGHEHFAYVSEFVANDDVVDISTEIRLLRVKQPSDKANGGQLLFGDDGYLYIFTGAGTGSGHDDDQSNNAQNPMSFLGKALRIDINSRGFERGDSASGILYEVPGSNPFYDRKDYRPEIFALGFRNPWRCSVDSASRGGQGDIYCGDVGSNRFEEINKIRRGRNYGWNVKEGNVCFHSHLCHDLEEEREPIYMYPYDEERTSAVVGGYVYRAQAFPDLIGQYIYGDAVTGRTFALREMSDGHYNSSELTLCPKQLCPCNAHDVKKAYLLAFGQDVNGEITLLMSSQFSALQPEGALFRVIAPTGTEKNPVTCGTVGLSSTMYLVLAALLARVLLNF